MASRRSGRGRGLASALDRDVPTNMKVFAGSVLGDKSPITEQNFRPEELQAMRSAILRKQGENDELEGMFRNGSDTMNMESGQWEPNDNSKEIASFDDSRGRTAIGYEDYDNAELGQENESSLIESFTSPDYNVATTLGQYVAHKDKDGKTVVRDVYDWNKVDSSEMSSSEMIKALMAADSLREMGNAAIRLFKPDVRREVVVDLGILDDND
jgi:hypothetical protein